MQTGKAVRRTLKWTLIAAAAAVLIYIAFAATVALTLSLHP